MSGVSCPVVGSRKGYLDARSSCFIVTEVRPRPPEALDGDARGMGVLEESWGQGRGKGSEKAAIAAFRDGVRYVGEGRACFLRVGEKRTL